MIDPTRSYHRTVEQADGHDVITHAFNDVPEPGTRCDHIDITFVAAKTVTGTFNNKLRHVASDQNRRRKTIRCAEDACRIINGMNLCPEHYPS